MATLDRQIPSPDTFVCKPWSSFVSASKLRFVGNAVSSLDNSDKELYYSGEAMKLSKEERLVYSPFPAPEDFCLVVCHVCSKVVTPQGILTHYEKRHSSPAPTRSPSVPTKPKAPAVAHSVSRSPGDMLAFRAPKDYPHSRFSKAPLAVYPPKGARTKTCVSLPIVSLEKMPCLGRADPTSHVRLASSSSSFPLKSSSHSPQVAQRLGEKLANGRGSGGPPTPRSVTPPSSLDKRPSPARSPFDRRASSTPSPCPPDRKPTLSSSPAHRSVALPGLPSVSASEKKQLNGNSSRPQKRLSGRIFDPNKHCGVQDPETKRQCTRSLTCKTHSLTHRRAVPGRRKNFDILLAEHKGLAKEREALKEKEKEKNGAHGGKEACSQSTPSQETVSPSKSHCPNGRLLSSLKLRLANAHIPRFPGGSSSSSTSSSLISTASPAQTSNLTPHGRAAVAGDSGRLSSDDGDTETPDETDRASFHTTNHHPQPLGVNKQTIKSAPAFGAHPISFITHTFCVFSSRLMGRGYYVFDRRWDRMRLALQSMVEKHRNAQMWRKVPPAAESLPSMSPQASSSPICINSLSNCYTPAFPQPASATRLFGIRNSPQPQVRPPGKTRNGTHKAGQSPKDLEDKVAGSKKRKHSAHTSLSLSSPSLFPTVDNHKKNGSSFHPTTQNSGTSPASPARKKELTHRDCGLLSRANDFSSRTDGSQSHNSLNSGIPRSPRESALHQTVVSPSGPLAYGGGAEGRKRRSPSSCKGKTSKLSRPGTFESLFGKGNESGGILASGPESPRQAKLHH